MLEEAKKKRGRPRKEPEVIAPVVVAKVELAKEDGRRFNKGRPRIENRLRMVYVRLTEEEIRSLDKFVKVDFTTRSGILRRALHLFFDREGGTEA